jgi:hypothetical protein
VGRGMQDAAAPQSPKVLPAGNPARWQRVPRYVASRPASSRAAPDQLGVVPALRPRGRDQLGEVAADVGKLEPAGEAAPFGLTAASVGVGPFVEQVRLNRGCYGMPRRVTGRTDGDTSGKIVFTR